MFNKLFKRKKEINFEIELKDCELNKDLFNETFGKDIKIGKIKSMTLTDKEGNVILHKDFGDTNV